MSGIRRRLERLERGRGRQCPKCGIDADYPPEYIVEWEDPPTTEEMREWVERYEAGLPPLVEEREEESPPCPRCSQREMVTIDWPDAPTRAERRQMEAAMLARGYGWPDQAPLAGGGGDTYWLNAQA